MAQQPRGATPPAPGREYRGLARILSSRLFDDVVHEVGAPSTDPQGASGPDGGSRIREQITESHRFETDISRVERALSQVTVAALGDGSRGTAVPLPASGDGWRQTELRPIGALRLVALPWRLLPWERKLERPRPTPSVARHGLRHLLLYARGGVGPPTLQWKSLAGGEGHLLSLVLHGTPLGRAVDHSVARGWVDDVATARALLDGWIAAGLFAGTAAVSV